MSKPAPAGERQRPYEGSYFQRLVRKIGNFMHRAAGTALVREGLRKAGVGHADRIRTYTHADELSALYQLARGCPPGANALEIGAHLGASTCYLGAGIQQRGGVLFSVDTWNNETMPEGEQDTFAQFVSNTRGLAGTVVPIRKRSADLTVDDLRTPLALVFIDGDHSYDAVKDDFTRTSQWLADGGLIALHDTVAFEGVGRLLGEVLASGRFRLEGHLKNLTWIRKM